MKKTIYFISLLVLLIGCQQSDNPVDIKFDRDVCERCKMVISDHRFATQIRGGANNQFYLFDDLGCAIHWLEEQTWKDEATTHIWVTDYRSGRWVNAYQAYYVSGQMTPMNYGIGATVEKMSHSVDFPTVKTKILAISHVH